MTTAGKGGGQILKGSSAGMKGGAAAGEAPSEPLTAEKTEASGSHRPNAELGFVPKPRGVSSVRVAAESQRRKRPREGP